MTTADREGSGAASTRLPILAIVCAVAFGIVGMHGLGSATASGGHVGHHPGAAIIATMDTAADGVGSVGARAGDLVPPAEDAGLLALCLLMLAPSLALVLRPLTTAARRASRCRPPARTRVVAALDVAVLPPPFERRLSVLRI